MRPLLCLLLSLFFLGAAAQNKVKGLLLLSPQRTNAFDLFYPLSLDPSRSLKSNIETAKEATACMIQCESSLLDKEILGSATLLRNTALGKGVLDSLDYILVLPVEVVLEGSKSAVFARNEKDTFLDWPVTLYNRNLFQFYNARLRQLVQLSVVPLQGK